MVPRVKPKEQPKPKQQMVRVIYIPDKTARLLQEGPEVSELMWSNGNRTFVSNEHIEKL